MKPCTGSELFTPNVGSCKTPSIDPDLSTISTFLQDTATRLGIDFTSWEIITDFQILKRKGDFHVNTMRCIQLMDTEFNMTKKNIGRRTLAHAKKANTVALD